MGLGEAPGVGNRSREARLGRRGGREGAAARRGEPRGAVGDLEAQQPLAGSPPHRAAGGKSDLERVTLCGTNTDAGVELSMQWDFSHPTPHPQPTPDATPSCFHNFSSSLVAPSGLERRKVGVRSPRWTSP